MYGLPELESACIKWLEYNLMLENSPDPVKKSIKNYYSLIFLLRT